MNRRLLTLLGLLALVLTPSFRAGTAASAPAKRHPLTSWVEIHPLAHSLRDGLLGATPQGDVLYFEFVPGLPRLVTWTSIGIWNPITGQRHTLFGPLPGYYAGVAQANADWAVATYGHAVDSDHAPPDNAGWELVTMNRHTGRTRVIAHDATGVLTGVAHRWNLQPLDRLWRSELVWTQFTGRPGHFETVLHLADLATGRDTIITRIPGAPDRTLDQPALHGPYLAYSIAIRHERPVPHYAETLILLNWRTQRVLRRIPDAEAPAFDPSGTHLYFSGNGVIGTVVLPDGRPHDYARGPGRPNEFWDPSAGQTFVTWYAEYAPWGKLRRTGQWLSIPQNQAHPINAVATGGSILAWSTISPGLVAPDPHAWPTIHAARWPQG